MGCQCCKKSQKIVILNKQVSPLDEEIMAQFRHGESETSLQSPSNGKSSLWDGEVFSDSYSINQAPAVKDYHRSSQASEERFKNNILTATGKSKPHQNTYQTKINRQITSEPNDLYRSQNLGRKPLRNSLPLATEASARNFEKSSKSSRTSQISLSFQLAFLVEGKAPVDREFLYGVNQKLIGVSFLECIIV